MGETISIEGIFKVLTKRWKLIVLLTLLVSSISGIISYFVLTPVYQASTLILVNQRNSDNQLDFTRLSNNIELISTYSDIIKSPVILDKVIKNLNLSESIEQLNRNIKVNNQQKSQVFSLTIEDSNQKKAVEIANELSITFQEDIKGIMNVDNVSILAKAVMKDNPIPVRPNPIMNIAIGIAVGLMSGIGLAFLLEYMDHSIKDSEDAIAYLGLPVLGSIQKIPLEKGKKRSEITMTQKVEG